MTRGQRQERCQSVRITESKLFSRVSELLNNELIDPIYDQNEVVEVEGG